MNLIELRDKLNEQIKLGVGHAPVAVLNSDGEYSKVTNVSFDIKDFGYVSCYCINFDS